MIFEIVFRIKNCKYQSVEKYLRTRYFTAINKIEAEGQCREWVIHNRPFTGENSEADIVNCTEYSVEQHIVDQMNSQPLDYA